MTKSEMVRASDLDMSVAEVHERWPLAVEYVALDGEPCWRRADLIDGPEAVVEGRP